MRDVCLNCARKHLAQAIVLATEQCTGYPAYKWLVIGHLAEAEAELAAEYTDLANEIREHRKAYEDDTEVELPLMEIIERITEIDDDEDDAEEEPAEEPKGKSK